MSSSTEPFAVIPTLVILLHWPLQPLQSKTLNRKTPWHNKIHYFWIRNVQVKSIWVDPRLMPHLFPEGSGESPQRLQPLIKFPVSWLAFASVIGLFERETPKVLIWHVALWQNSQGHDQMLTPGGFTFVWRVNVLLMSKQQTWNRLRLA